MLVICSFSGKPVRFTPPKGYDLKKGELLLANYPADENESSTIILQPYETRVYRF